MLRDLQKGFENEGLHQMRTKTLLKKLIQLPESPWAGRWAKDIHYDNIQGPAAKMAWLLKDFGLASKTLKFANEPGSKGYTEVGFTDAWARYL